MGTGLVTRVAYVVLDDSCPANSTEQRRDWKGREARLRGKPAETGGGSRSPGKPDPAHDVDGRGGRSEITRHGAQDGSER